MEQKKFETLLMKLHIIIGGLSENILALPLFLLLIFSIIVIFVKKKYKNNLILMLLCGLFLPIIIALLYLITNNKFYMVPLIPTIILLIATSVSYLKINIRRILLFVFIAVSFYNILNYPTDIKHGFAICKSKLMIISRLNILINMMKILCSMI
jgi:hypothetical protein